eukprot:316577_1
MTSLRTGPPMYDSAICLMYHNTIEEISSGNKRFFSALYSTSIAGRSCDSRTTLNGHNLMSPCTTGSSNLRPIKRLESKTVFSAFRAAWFFAAVRPIVQCQRMKHKIVWFVRPCH